MLDINLNNVKMLGSSPSRPQFCGASTSVEGRKARQDSPALQQYHTFLSQEQALMTERLRALNSTVLTTPDGTKVRGIDLLARVDEMYTQTNRSLSKNMGRLFWGGVTGIMAASVIGIPVIALLMEPSGLFKQAFSAAPSQNNLAHSLGVKETDLTRSLKRLASLGLLEDKSYTFYYTPDPFQPEMGEAKHWKASLLGRKVVAQWRQTQTLEREALTDTPQRPAS